MNINTIGRKLSEAGIEEADYAIGDHPDETLCLTRGANEGTWEVYYQERGKKEGLQTFDNEEAACYHLYAYLVESYVMSMRLVPVPTGTGERTE